MRTKPGLRTRGSTATANPVFSATHTAGSIFNKHHVRGATRVEYDQVKASDLPTDKSAPIVFYCMNERCGASPIAAKQARELGWTNVYLIPAGGARRYARFLETDIRAGSRIRTAPTVLAC